MIFEVFGRNKENSRDAIARWWEKKMEDEPQPVSHEVRWVDGGDEGQPALIDVLNGVVILLF